MKGLAEAKACILRAQNQDQLYKVVEEICFNAGYRFEDDSSLMENSRYAAMQQKHGIAELLRFADIKEGKL
jgi:hypothetical protein